MEHVYDKLAQEAVAQEAVEPRHCVAQQNGRRRATGHTKKDHDTSEQENIQNGNGPQKHRERQHRTSSLCLQVGKPSDCVHGCVGKPLGRSSHGAT